jgi:primase-polymerase (primpol)-like protein
MAAVTRASLVAEPVWVAWRQETRKGKVTKVPYSPLTGQRAQTDNPETWATRDASDAWAETHQAAGVGLMFAQVGDDFIGGVDLDSCRDRNTGEIAGWAQVVIERFDTYAEVSPSETGVQTVFCRTPRGLGEGRSAVRRREQFRAQVRAAQRERACAGD